MFTKFDFFLEEEGFLQFYLIKRSATIIYSFVPSFTSIYDQQW